MDGAGEHFFAGSAFSGEEDGSVRRSDALDFTADTLNADAFADDFGDSVVALELFFKKDVFEQKPPLFEGTLDKEKEVGDIDRFRYEIESTFFHGLHGFF